MRLRTLPLASAGIILGSLLSYDDGFTGKRFLYLLLTAVLLQILSNLANDYGDAVKGTDNSKRIGEARMVSSGAISATAMRNAIVLFSLLSFASGTLLLMSLELSKEVLWFFYGVGILCIVAAITYTVGKKAYGYSGFGDIAVFIFFGIVSVAGTNFLLSGEFHPLMLLPAAAMGLLATAVLNLNNLRDHINDKASGKNTLVVKMGFAKAKLYHTFLLSLPLVLGFLFMVFQNRSPFRSPFQNTDRYYSVIESSASFGQYAICKWLFLLTAPILLKLSSTVKKTTDPALLDGELKKQALTALLFAVLFGVGNILAS